MTFPLWKKSIDTALTGSFASACGSVAKLTALTFSVGNFRLKYSLLILKFEYNLDYFQILGVLQRLLE